MKHVRRIRPGGSAYNPDEPLFKGERFGAGAHDHSLDHERFYPHSGLSVHARPSKPTGNTAIYPYAAFETWPLSLENLLGERALSFSTALGHLAAAWVSAQDNLFRSVKKSMLVNILRYT